MKKVISALTPQTVLLFIVSVLFWHGSLQFIGTKYHLSTVIAWVFCIAFSVFSGISLKDDLDRLDEATTSKITPAASNEFGNSTLGESSPTLLEGQGLEKDAKEVGGRELLQMQKAPSPGLMLKSHEFGGSIYSGWLNRSVERLLNLLEQIEESLVNRLGVAGAGHVGYLIGLVLGCLIGIPLLLLLMKK